MPRIVLACPVVVEHVLRDDVGGIGWDGDIDVVEEVHAPAGEGVGVCEVAVGDLLQGGAPGAIERGEVGGADASVAGEVVDGPRLARGLVPRGE